MYEWLANNWHWLVAGYIALTVVLLRVFYYIGKRAKEYDAAMEQYIMELRARTIEKENS